MLVLAHVAAAERAHRSGVLPELLRLAVEGALGWVPPAPGGAVPPPVGGLPPARREGPPAVLRLRPPGCRWRLRLRQLDLPAAQIARPGPKASCPSCTEDLRYSHRDSTSQLLKSILPDH